MRQNDTSDLATILRSAGSLALPRDALDGGQSPPPLSRAPSLCSVPTSLVPHIAKQYHEEYHATTGSSNTIQSSVREPTPCHPRHPPTPTILYCNTNHPCAPTSPLRETTQGMAPDLGNLAGLRRVHRLGHHPFLLSARLRGLCAPRTCGRSGARGPCIHLRGTGRRRHTPRVIDTLRPATHIMGTFAPPPGEISRR